MDWGNVTAEDLIDALREVDWSSPPRPLSEFFSRFTVPRSSAKWNSRLKCNLYYYRTNYFIMITVILGLGFLRRPVAIIAALLTALSIAFLNDSFAGTFNEKVTRTVRQFSPHLAAKMRPPLTKFHPLVCFLWSFDCSMGTCCWTSCHYPSCKFSNSQLESTSEYIQRGIPCCLAQL
ncbi:PRA1 family protein A1-like isoform X2 [Citrus sinensis]|uniref:PRA1 family protein A1-like isoform X2 n=1 Tax=Citrus sinensis TaxID=2711 RepID=UPI000D631227|nr:PRA1 family protein A1-like isoform X2 [Citrus sinensis]